MLSRPMIRIRDMSYRVAGRLLFDGATATVPAGHKVGLVGRNGTGKSTLLKLLTGQIQPDAGDVLIDGIAGKTNAIGMVEQEAPSGEQTPLSFALAANVERRDLLERANVEKDPARIAEIQTRLVDIGAHTAPARAASILAGLGFDEMAQKRSLSSFSGGWRMRVAIAALLFAEPELLLLDEPTNHLDLEAAMWLESHLRAYTKTMLVVSHDRELLNRAVTGILHIENLKLTYYTGGYDQFERVRQERVALQKVVARKQVARRKHMRAFVDRFRYKASKARQAQSRLKALERMDVISTQATESTTSFRFPEPEVLPPPLVTLDGVSVGYLPGQSVLSGIDLRLDSNDRIGFLGQNGNGKSTLAKLIAGRLSKMAGEEHRSAKLRVGFFAQHQIEDLNPEETATDHLCYLMPDAPKDRLRAYLGGVGLIQDKQTSKVKFLSGGEKARLTIALITHNSPHVLILDEPTNHLDIDARDALVQALNDYAGAVILISHDRRLLELTVDHLWLVADGTVQPFEGDLGDYAGWLRDQSRSTARYRNEWVGSDDPSGSHSRMGRREARKASAERRRETAGIRKAAQEAEKALEDLTVRRDSLIAKLSTTETYEGLSTEDLKKLILDKESLDREIERAEATWLNAAEALEAAE